MATLYEITGQFKELMEMADECNLTQADISDTLEGLDWEFEEKADAYAKVFRQLEEDASSIDAEIKRLTEKKKTLNNNAKAIKTNLEKAMIETGKRKFKTLLFSFGIQKNPPSVVIEDESKVPDAYRIKQPDKIDKKALIKDLKNTDVLDFGYAHLTQSESLRIR